MQTTVPALFHLGPLGIQPSPVPEEKQCIQIEDTERETWVPDFKFENRLLNVMRKTKI